MHVLRQAFSLYSNLSVKTKLFLFVICFSLWLIAIATVGIISARSQTAAQIMFAMGSIAVILAVFFGTIIGRSIIIPLSQILSGIASISKGDLTVRIPVETKEDMGQLADKINSMTIKLALMVSSIIQNAERISASSTQIHSSSAQISQETIAISDKVMNLSTASEELSATASEISRTCLSAAEDAQVVADSAMTGEKVVVKTTHTMAQISAQVSTTAQSVTELGKTSDQIGDIADTIGDIADQTNLLALNAAIEAARAGDHGRGFAVVADEVKKLAERTSQATREIGSMIATVQAETHGIVKSMESGVASVQAGGEEVGKSGETLQTILVEVGELQQMVAQIATAAEEQSATVADISQTIGQVSNLLQATSNQTLMESDVADQLSMLSESLHTMVAEFTVGEAEEVALIQLARTDHKIFVKRIERALKKEIYLKAASLPDHTLCRFGKWYSGKGLERGRQISAFQAIDEPHRRIHQLATEALQAHEAGRIDEERRIMADIRKMSVQIDGLLAELGNEYTRRLVQ